MVDHELESSLHLTAVTLQPLQQHSKRASLQIFLFRSEPFPAPQVSTVAWTVCGGSNCPATVFVWSRVDNFVYQARRLLRA
eukprot:3628927-Rhodomonas_salina.8